MHSSADWLSTFVSFMRGHCVGFLGYLCLGFMGRHLKNQPSWSGQPEVLYTGLLDTDCISEDEVEEQMRWDMPEFPNPP